MRQIAQESLLSLSVPVGLLSGAEHLAVGGKEPTRPIGALLAGTRVALLTDFFDAQVRIDFVADVVEDDRLLVIANHDPFAGLDLKLGHRKFSSLDHFRGVYQSTCLNPIASALDHWGLHARCSSSNAQLKGWQRH